MSDDDTDELRKVDGTWPPVKIREFCEQEDNWVLALDDAMSPSELEALYQRQLAIATPYLGLIGEIAGHENTPAHVIEDCVRRFPGSAEVMASVALSPAASEQLLTDLLSHEHEAVRQHASQALIRKRKPT